MKVAFSLLLAVLALNAAADKLTLNDKDYFDEPGLQVTSFADFYPEGHQSGVTVIQHGVRVAANGDLRLEASPGQWSPTPKKVSQTVDREHGLISTELTFPNEDIDRKGFNPIVYPQLQLSYRVQVQALAGNSFKVWVDLDKPLPKAWVGKVGFNFELFPGALFGKGYWLDGRSGYFPQQAFGPMTDDTGAPLTRPLASGHTLVVAPEEPLQRLKIESAKTELTLIDGRSNHNNSWYIVRSTIPAGKTSHAIEWVITPNVDSSWRYGPILQVSQVGYTPQQNKTLIIEQDPRDGTSGAVEFYRLDADGKHLAATIPASDWGDYLRYHYLRVDFTSIAKEGLYQAEFHGKKSHIFRISKDVFARGVWQPTLDFFLPVQMCHMRVVENYRVWHGLCHEDDARMAPINHNHFDGYISGNSTLTKFKPGDAVPGLNRGGWHDAGDYDLRVESQSETVWGLATMVEEFGLNYDSTSIDETKKLVQIHKPDGKSDALQQIEHGLLSILGGYDNLGRLYRGIISPTLDQYVLLGDAASQTDGKVDADAATLSENLFHSTNGGDDRWVFTEDNPDRELFVAAGLASASRVLKRSNPDLSAHSLNVAESLYKLAAARNKNPSVKIFALSELILSAKNNRPHIEDLLHMQSAVLDNAGQCAWSVGRVLPQLKDRDFAQKLASRVQQLQQNILLDAEKSPYGVPYKPYIWGAGWTLQEFGVRQYFMHKAWPKIVTTDLYMNALNFILGVHPGENTASFVSGVGSNSVTVAYGANRADWSFIPGGSVSGTGLIRPDLPELKTWPYFWQQTEYVLGGGTTNFMILALAANKTLN